MTWGQDEDSLEENHDDEVIVPNTSAATRSANSQVCIFLRCN